MTELEHRTKLVDSILDMKSTLSKRMKSYRKCKRSLLENLTIESLESVKAMHEDDILNLSQIEDEKEDIDIREVRASVNDSCCMTCTSYKLKRRIERQSVGLCKATGEKMFSNESCAMFEKVIVFKR